MKDENHHHIQSP
jgi:hypothetical protein